MSKHQKLGSFFWIFSNPCFADFLLKNAPKQTMMYAGVYVGSTLLGGFLAGMFHKIFHARAMVAAENAKD